ncbi:hypothetical protein N9I33_01010 [Paracoccaceae bacterium]|jgi:hypothetical protein|nr:hypothetical protein [Paracoccaceae bacterium]
MRSLLMFFLIIFASQSAAKNWTCAPEKYADGSAGHGGSFVLLENGKDYDMRKGQTSQKLKFLGEYLTTYEWQKMYLDERGHIGVIWLRGVPGFKDGKADYIAAYPNYSGFIKTTCDQF